MSAAAPQKPGCLPAGFNQDSLLTIGQFAVWTQMSERAVRRRLKRLPGCVREDRRNIKFHPRTYLETRLKKGAK